MTYDATADMVTAAAPLIAAALTSIPRAAAVQFAYNHDGVRVTAARPDQLDRVAMPLIDAFTSAGWGFSTRTVYGERTGLNFEPPHLLTQVRLPVERDA